MDKNTRHPVRAYVIRSILISIPMCLFRALSAQFAGIVNTRVKHSKQRIPG